MDCDGGDHHDTGSRFFDEAGRPVGWLPAPKAGSRLPDQDWVVAMDWVCYGGSGLYAFAGATE